MKKNIIIIILTLLTYPVLGQDSLESFHKDSSLIRLNVLFGELGGSGLLFSMNYERLLNNKFGVRVGVGSAGLMGLTFPAILNYYIGKEKKLELGLGLIYTDYFPNNGGKYISNGEFLITATIGHKFQSEKRGIVFRFSFTPIYNLIKDKILPFGGISIGYAF